MTLLAEAETEQEILADEIAAFTHDPMGYARFAFDWGHGELAGEDLRYWQGVVLGAIGDRLQNPATRHQPIRIAIASGHGVGKSALVGMVTKWALDTCVDTRIVVTANTDTQLRNKTWPEISKWARLAISHAWFVPTATSLYSVEEDRVKSWRADAVPWSKENTEAFAGLHNKRRRIVVIFDEASAIDDKIWEVTEGALTDADTEIIWLAFGNPTRASGRFRECFRSQAHLWIKAQIDSRDVEGTNKALFAEWAETYGVDSDFFKIRVRGLFPSLSARQLIPEHDVDAAYGKHLDLGAYNFAPKILCCDPAWEGDDTLEIGLRQGLAFRLLLSLPKNNNDVNIANILARFEDDHDADAVMIDKGYGTGIYSAGQTMGRDWLLVDFGGASADPGCLNKRAEIWNATRQWLQDGGAIPADPELRDDLLSVETIPRLDGKIALESKAAMKKRGLRSPNKGDCLAISFGYPVAPRNVKRANQRLRNASHNPRA
jgi:hypothetical protein